MRTIRNCSVCVVGGAGFLGSHLVDHLVEDRGCNVLVLDNLCVGRKEFIHKKAEFHHCDITKSESHLKNVFVKHQVKYVLNYAAHPYIPDSFVRPLHVFETNATGAMNVINAAQEAGCEAILQVSSAEIYGDGKAIAGMQDARIDEDDWVRPHSTYGVAKAAVDYYCQSAWKERKTPVISLRQFNCIGPRETHPYVVPEIISQLGRQQIQYAKDGKTWYHGKEVGIVRLGNNSFRDFQYAGDAVRMATELLEKGQFGQVYNMGSEGGVKIYDLASMIGEIMGFGEVRVAPDESRIRPWEIWHLQSDNSKLYETIEARPTVTLREALVNTVDDYYGNGCKWSWQ